MSARTPGWLERLAALLLDPRDREYMLGDLHEEFAEHARTDGTGRARRWYGRELLRSTPASLRRRWRRRGSVAGGRRAGLPPAGTFLDSVVRDARMAARGIRRTPGHAGLVALTLALGIGATSAIFTVVDRVLLQPPPYPNASELVTVWNTYPEWRGHHVLDSFWDRIALSWPEYVDWRDGQTSFHQVAIYGARPVALTGAGDPVRLRAGLASSTLFPMLGVKPALGRFFSTDEEGPARRRVAVLGHGLWRDRFGADPSMAGRTIDLDGIGYAVVGVLPPDFRFRTIEGFSAGSELDVWIPIGADGADLDRGNHNYESIARLRDDRTIADATRESAVLLSGGGDPDWAQRARIVRRHDAEVGAARAPLLLLLGSVGLLMLLACANVATLFLGQVAGRRPELATRAALGAGRFRLIRQLLVESFVLGGLGVVGGIGVAQIGQRLLLRWAPPELRLPAELSVDWRMLGFAAGLGMVASLFFGLLPALLVRRLRLGDELRGGFHRIVQGSGSLQRALIAAQFAVSGILLVGTGLLARSLAAELAVDPGFSADRLLGFEIQLPADRYDTNASRSTFFDELSLRLAAQPGIRGVTATSALPLSGRTGSSSFQIRGREVPDGEKSPEARRSTVMPGFHEALGIPLIEGRSIRSSDRDDSAPVVLVSESMAERFWPGRSPLGERIVRDRREFEIVGVVGDVLSDDLTGEVKATFYVPLHQAENRSAMTVVAVTTIEPGRLAGTVRDVVWDLDADLPIEQIEPVSATFSRATQDGRYRALILTMFSIAAVLLAGVGIFGITARTLAQRFRELGVRLALGADPGRLVRQIVGREAVSLGIGVAAGLVGALLAARLLEGFLFRVDGHDPLTFLTAGALLAGLGLAASYLAARRVSALDPATVLREE